MQKKGWLISLLSVELAALYPLIFTYSQNVAEVDFVEVLPLVLLYSAIGISLWAISCLVTNSPFRSAFSTILLMLFLMNYMLIQKVVQMVLPNLKYWHILPIGLFVLGHVIYLIFRFKEEALETVVSVVSLVMAALLFINLIPAVPTILQKMTIEKENKEDNYTEAVSAQPNIYWFILDECASFSVIENVYGVSDKDNYNTLFSQGFNISNSSRNEATDTYQVMTNCINLDYVVDGSMNGVEMEAYRQEPLLYTTLKEHDYMLRGIGDTGWLNIESLTTDKKTVGTTADGAGVVEMQLQHSVIGPFLSPSRREDAMIVLDTLEYFKQKENISPNSAQFNLVYICSPHVPFLFDENGNDVSAHNYNNWEEPKYYVGQYQFIMNQIVEVTDSIIKNDPDSVIILQSDHGPRHTEGLTDEDKTSVLNCVYYSGENFSEIEGKSAVNTLRLILNRLLGCQFEEVAVKNE